MQFSRKRRWEREWYTFAVLPDGVDGVDRAGLPGAPFVPRPESIVSSSRKEIIEGKEEEVAAELVVVEMAVAVIG